MNQALSAPFFALVGIALVTVKVAGYIDWVPWMWVLTPFWFPVAFFLFFWSFVGSLFIAAGVLNSILRA